MVFSLEAALSLLSLSWKCNNFEGLGMWWDARDEDERDLGREGSADDWDRQERRARRRRGRWGRIVGVGGLTKEESWALVGVGVLEGKGPRSKRLGTVSRDREAVGSGMETKGVCRGREEAGTHGREKGERGTV
jgi:hypothetical protein